MTVRSRLALALTVLGLLLALPSLYGLTRLVKLRDIAVEFRSQQSKALEAAKTVQVALGELDRHARSYIVAPDSTSREAMWKALNRADAAMDRLRYAGHYEESAVTAASLDALQSEISRIEALMESGRALEATARFQQTKTILQDTRSGLEPIASAIDRASADAATRAGRISDSAASAVWAFSTASIILAALLGLWITRALTGPLERLQVAMERVAEGDFEVPRDLPYERTDELGELCRSFRSMTAQLDELQRLRAEFVSVASHELKTPLNVIGGYAEILDEGQFGEVTEEQRESLRTISQQVSLLSSRVNQLLDLSRFEAGAFHLVIDEVHVEDLLHGVADAFEALARQQGIDFSLQIDPSVPETFRGDMDRLRNEVFGNLLSNAFKFTPRGGRITVRATGSEDDLRVEVEDTGEGIPQEDLGRVFDKFYQHASRARAKGAGLGLAIARDIVEAHGGRIDVSSAVGAGTTFRFTLPLDHAAQTGEASQLEAYAARPSDLGARLRVVVSDATVEAKDRAVTGDRSIG